MPPDSERSVIKEELKEIFRILAVSLLIVIPVRLFIAQPFIVRGASMEPNFHDGEYLVVDELSYQFRKPERGEVIVLRYPRDPSQYFIKRVIGLPAETVIISDGEVKIRQSDTKKELILTEPYIPEGIETDSEVVVTLNPGEYFVLGDNRGSSSDSRAWGKLGEDYIVGRAFMRLWPLSRLGIF